MRKVALDVHKRISYVVIREGKQEVMRRSSARIKRARRSCWERSDPGTG
jgi:hypothetical protein